MKIINYIFKLFPIRVQKFFKNIRNKFKAKYIQITRKEIGRKQIVKNLKMLGIKNRDIIIVHSSLKSIGYVKEGAETVIDALMEAVGCEGTLVMPALSISGSMVETLESGIVFNAKTTPSKVGLITETFRKRPNVYRSIHPTHSFCAWGAEAEHITKDHEYASSNFGPGTPLYKIMEKKGYILGIGIYFGPITFVHAIEDTVENFPKKVYCSEEYIIKVIDMTGKEKYMKVKAHDCDVSRTRIDKEEGRWISKFFTEYLTKKGILRTGHIGEAESWIISTRDLFNAQKELLKEGITIYTTEEEYKSLSFRYA